MIMTTEIKDQTKRQESIRLLETVIEKNAAAITMTRLTLHRQTDKQINRLAELRHQKMLLKWQLAAAAKAAKAQPATP